MHRPQKADELARHRDDGDLGPLAIRQMIEPLMQPLLRLPRVRDHRRRLVRLPAFEIDARLRAMPIAPRRLDQDVATVTVARLRDRAEPRAIAARVLARNEAEIARPAGADRSNRRQSTISVASTIAECSEMPRKHWSRRTIGASVGQQRELFDLPIELVTPLQLVHQQRVILAIHQPIVRRERRALGREVLQPLEMRRAPVRPLAEHEPAAGEELEDIVARLEDLALERLPAAHDIAHPLLRFARNPHDARARRRDRGARDPPRRACRASAARRAVSE